MLNGGVGGVAAGRIGTLGPTGGSGGSGSGRTGAKGGSRCQFRTRPDGTVYPLARTCNPREPAVGYVVNAYGERVSVGSRDYDGDHEEF